ncbi:major facilitator superfamily domain-containing protein 1-like [Phymastichus coffea]|uniref:major facilitator superfamily domain-containing protein 1-like n=1 Tax=Phymastichus coffea TaxID=108790 RepID=UPI00273AC8D7|nr:major facilitator superfamily domain-containing protein 1-like [Phymastichus coffea]
MDSQYKVCNISEDELIRQRYANRNKFLFRYFGLIIICLLGFGLYFCYDNPGALQDKFEKEMNMTTTKFSMLYSVYSWPNVVLCFFGGFLIDSVFGVRWGTIIYVFVALCGQLIFAMGTYMDIFWLMILGRFIFGIGSEAVYIAQSNYTVFWFKGRALNAIFGLQWSFGQTGSIVNFLSIGSIYKFVEKNSNSSTSQCIGMVLLFAAIICAVSLICAIVLAVMHSHAGKILEHDEEKQPHTVKFADIKVFQLTYWLIVLLCAAYTAAIYPFISLAKMYFVKMHDFKPDDANKLVSLVYTTSAICSPFIGLMIDNCGRNILWVMVGIIGSLLSHIVLAFTKFNPHTCMISLGVFNSLFGTSVWPMIAHVMPEHQLGMAYGINQSIINLSIAVVSIICGKIVDKLGYLGLDVFFLAWLLVSMVPAVMIWKSNRTSTADKTQVIVEKPKANPDTLEDALLDSSVKSVKEKSAVNKQELIQKDHRLFNR